MLVCKILWLFIHNKIFIQNIDMYKLLFRITIYSSRIMDYLYISYTYPGTIACLSELVKLIKLIFENNTLLIPMETWIRLMISCLVLLLWATQYSSLSSINWFKWFYNILLNIWMMFHSRRTIDYSSNILIHIKEWLLCNNRSILLWNIEIVIS